MRSGITPRKSPAIVTGSIDTRCITLPSFRLVSLRDVAIGRCTTVLRLGLIRRSRAAVVRSSRYLVACCRKLHSSSAMDDSRPGENGELRGRDVLSEWEKRRVEAEAGGWLCHQCRRPLIWKERFRTGVYLNTATPVSASNQLESFSSSI